MTDVKLTICSDGISAKWFNTRITLINSEKADTTNIQFIRVNPNKTPLIQQIDTKGISVTRFNLSDTAIEVLHKLLTIHLRKKNGLIIKEP